MPNENAEGLGLQKHADEHIKNVGGFAQGLHSNFTQFLTDVRKHESIKGASDGITKFMDPITSSFGMKNGSNMLVLDTNGDGKVDFDDLNPEKFVGNIRAAQEEALYDMIMTLYVVPTFEQRFSMILIATVGVTVVMNLFLLVPTIMCVVIAVLEVAGACYYHPVKHLGWRLDFALFFASIMTLVTAWWSYKHFPLHDQDIFIKKVQGVARMVSERVFSGNKRDMVLGFAAVGHVLGFLAGPVERWLQARREKVESDSKKWI